MALNESVAWNALRIWRLEQAADGLRRRDIGGFSIAGEDARLDPGQCGLGSWDGQGYLVCALEGGLGHEVLVRSSNEWIVSRRSAFRQAAEARFERCVQWTMKHERLHRIRFAGPFELFGAGVSTGDIDRAEAERRCSR